MLNYLEVTPDMLINSEVQLANIQPEDMTTKLDGKKGLSSWFCFIVYYLSGSANKAANYINNTLGLRTERGNKFNPNAIRMKAWEWILQNPGDARQFFDKDNTVRYGKPMTDSDYNMELVLHAVNYKAILSDRQLVLWMEKYGLTKPEYIEKTLERRPRVYRTLSEKYS